MTLVRSETSKEMKTSAMDGGSYGAYTKKKSALSVMGSE